jgi:hypothetical protein
VLLSGVYEQPVACLLLVVAHHLGSNFFSLYNLSLDARYALKSSGLPDDELPPEASKLQAVRILLIAALS